MNTHKLFLDFDSTIKLSTSKVAKLESNRRALRKKIKDNFEDNGWESPKFYSQGSFPLNSNLNPIKKIMSDGDIKEEYDLDDGVYFVCPRTERKEAATYHDRIKKAVEGHAVGVVDKNTCVRVIYADGHHIDLPCYWLEKEGNTPRLAHKSKGFIDSDPKAFRKWVDGKISSADSSGQLRRVIRYFKAWKNYRENQNARIKLPSGFILTILICQNYSKNERDDLAFLRTAKVVQAALERDFACYRPTIPTDEDLLENYSKDTVLGELENLVSNVQNAIESSRKKEASEFLRNVMGERFPLREEEEEEDEDSNSFKAVPPVCVKVSSPWLSN